MPTLDNMWHYVLYCVILIAVFLILKNPKK